MKNTIKLLVIFILISTKVYGQHKEFIDTSSTKLMLVVKHDGAEFIGYILSDNGQYLIINTKELGKVYIRKEGVKLVKFVEDAEFKKSGVYDPSGVFTTRYYFTNNAISSKKRDNYSMIHLYGPEIHFSLGNGLSFGMMSSWGFSPFIAVLKKSFKTNNDKINISIGTMVGSSVYLNTFRGWGAMHWTTLIYGVPKHNLSVSAGYLYVQPGFNNQDNIKVLDGVYSEINWDFDDIYSNNGISPMLKTPMLSIAGIWKVGKKASFIFDSMFSIRKVKKREQDFIWNDLNNDNMEVYGEHFFEVKSNDLLTTMFFVMPGMRFQKSNKRAFQIALAGCTYFRGTEINAFPVPMCSWFLKF